MPSLLPINIAINKPFKMNILNSNVIIFKTVILLKNKAAIKAALLY